MLVAWVVAFGRSWSPKRKVPPVGGGTWRGVLGVARPAALVLWCGAASGVNRRNSTAVRVGLVLSSRCGHVRRALRRCRASKSWHSWQIFPSFPSGISILSSRHSQVRSTRSSAQLSSRFLLASGSLVPMPTTSCPASARPPRLRVRFRLTKVGHRRALTGRNTIRTFSF